MSIMKSSNLHDVKKPLNIMIYNCLMKLTLLASISIETNRKIIINGYQ